MLGKVTLGKLFRVLMISLTLFIFSFTSVSAGDVLFETIMPWYYWWSDILMGNGVPTYVSKFAVGYRPTTNQELCTVKIGLYKSGNPTDNIIMTIRSITANYPLIGQIIGTKTIPSNQVSSPSLIPAIAAFTSFPLDTCLNLTANTNYSFVFERTQPNSSNYFFYQLSGLIYYAQTRLWGYVPVNGFWQEKFGYEPALRLEGPDTKEPVIIVPGILGSRLNRVSDGEEVWPNIGKMANPFTPKDEFLDDLKLDENSNEIIDVNTSGIVESVLGTNQYGNLIQNFKNNGYVPDKDLFIIPYDWRLDIEKSSLDLDLIVNQALNNSPTGKVNIIAHSMGGLLVKDYLIRNGDSSINKLIFAGTPHLGAPKAFNLLNWGDDFDLKFLGFGLNKNKAKEIGQNMPAVYELLPGREYFNKAGAYVKNDNLVGLNYDETNELMSSGQFLADHRNSSLLNKADEFHKSHDSWLPQSANVYNLLGCREYDTIGSFKLDSDGSVDIDSVTGDGTVPLASAEHISGSNYFVSYPQTKINHVGLISDDRTIGLLYDIVASKSEVLPVGISKSSDDCDNILDEVKRLRFSTHSPVNLHVYDNLGNHTGLTSEGNIETNILDSNFFQAGDSTFIFVPNEFQYSISIDAYATGSFDFKVKELINGQAAESVVYNNIPINNPELNANLEFIGITSQSYLNVDEEGDGEMDIGYSPDGTKILYHDEEPPTININSPISGGEYERSTVLFIDFSVIDNSDIYYASASFDNILWLSSRIDLFFSPLGSHSFTVISQDEAGNKSSKSIDFVSIATIESMMSDINRTYELGWIYDERDKDSYLHKLEKLTKLETKIEIIQETMPDGEKKEKKIERLEKKIDKLLAIQFLKDLEKDYNKGRINKKAYGLIKEDILWLLGTQ